MRGLVEVMQGMAVVNHAVNWCLNTPNVSPGSCLCRMYFECFYEVQTKEVNYICREINRYWKKKTSEFNDNSERKGERDGKDNMIK